MSQATPTSSSSTATAPIGAAADPLTATVFGRYRVMAFITGGFLLLLCVEMILRYVLKLDWVKDVFGWVPFVHGWIYVIYAITCLQLWSKARWGLGRLAWLARGGVDILLTHAPPTGPHSGSDFAHRGCPELGRFMLRRRPPLVVHGHIHEYEGRKLEYLDGASGARVVNAYGYRVLEV